MAVIFYNQVITQAGYNLIAQATSSNPIVYVKGYSNAAVLSDPTDASLYTGVEGVIDASSAEDNIARIVVSYGNSATSSSQAVKAIAISARLASQTDADAVIFSWCADPDSTIVFPPNTTVAQTTRFAFNIAIGPGETIATVQSGDATLADLERLVSCHKAGDPNEGVDQTILGEKVFKGTIKAWNIQSDGADAGYHLLVTGGKRDPQGIKVGWDSNDNLDEIYIGGMGGGWVFRDAFLRADGGGVIGNTTYPINRIVATTIEPTNLGTSSHKVTQIYAQNIGTNSYKVNDIFAKRFFGGTFYGSLVDGTTPQPTYDSTAASPVKIPVGGIAFVFVYYDWSYTLHCGETFQCGPLTSHYTTIREAKYIDDTPAPHWEPGEVVETDNGGSTYYTWKLLSCLDSESGLGTNSYGMALVMRIE